VSALLTSLILTVAGLAIDRSQQEKRKRPRPPQVAASHGEQCRFCQL